MQRTRRSIKAMPEVSAVAHHGGLRMLPLCASLIALGLSATFGQLHAQTISLTTASPSYSLTGGQTVTAITVADGVTNGTITGSGYTLTYSGAASPFAIGGTAVNQTQSLDMSGLTNFVFDNPTQAFSVGGQLNGGSAGSATGTLTLAAGSNIITASSFGVADVSRNVSAANSSNIGTLNLGQSNTINADTITFGVNQNNSTVQFASGITDGTLVLRGTDGTSSVANWNIGTGANSNYVGISATADFSAGSIDAVVTNLLIGQHQSNSTSAAGTLILGDGTLDATSIILGQQTSNQTGSIGSATGTLTINDATVTVQTLTIGDHSGTTTGGATGTVNLNGGALLAQTIQSGAGNATRNFNWKDGTLGNYASGEDMTVSIPTITLGVGGNPTFDIEGAGATATVSSVLTGAGGFTKTGAGILALTGGNTYTGGTTVTDGLVNFSKPANLSTGAITLNGGGLQWATGNTTDVSAQLNPLGANGAIFDTNGNNVTFGTALSGGALVKNGTGTLLLTADNTYTGGTTINAGTLQLGNGSTIGRVVGNITDNGALIFDESNHIIFGGTITGSGALTQASPYVVALTANNTYTGGTTINSGTLQVGVGGTTGGIVGNVVDNRALGIDRSDTVIFPGVISGNGLFLQEGTGTVILTGDNTYTGPTSIYSGKLQLGDGSSSGSVAGDISIGATSASASLIIDRNNTLTLSGTIYGIGSLSQIGSGTTILTSDNTYSGGTTISAGTLQLGNGSTSGSIVGDVTDNGTLAFDRTDNVTFAGTISGTGALNQIGSGTTIFTGNNTYSGGTTISAGVLQLGNGGTTGSIVGPVVDNTSLVVDNNSTVTLPGVISGNGALSQIGSGTTILTGENSYSGGTTISAGTLQFGNGGTSGSIVGDVTDNGTLAFNRSDDISYSNIVSGSGGLTQLGSGTLTLQGAQTYTGSTNVLGGVLELDGSIQSATTTVGANGTLSGFGDVYGNVTNQGTIWPGHAIVGDTNYGALTIHGNYVGNNGVLELNTFLGADGSPSDQLVINGGTATGNTSVVVHNTNTSSGETTGNGILVVSAVNGATTASNAF